ncbi:MAG: hypothetical protein ACK4ND_13470 [Cytophagaceae bacterium]
MFFIMLMGISSCGKYEEGPKFSLASKKGRICNKWKLNEKFENGIKQSLISDDVYLIELTKEHSVIGYRGSTSMLWGTWSFDETKEHLVIVDRQGNIYTSKILRLKKKELWLEDVDGVHKEERRYVAVD